MAAVSIVAGAGLALFGAQAFAQNTSYTTGGVSAGISSGTSETSKSKESSIAAQGTEGTGTTNSGTTAGDVTLGGSSSSNTSGSSDDSSFVFAASRESHFFHEVTWHKSGAELTSTSGGSGESLAAVFVFGQNIVLSNDATLENDSGAHTTALIDKSFTALTGAAPAGVFQNNNAAGVGNQQGNYMATLTELSGATSGPVTQTNSGSNALNVTSAQNLVLNDSTVGTEEYVHARTLACNTEADPDCIRSNIEPAGDVATIESSFVGVTGAVQNNNASGVANQQVNSILLAH